MRTRSPILRSALVALALGAALPTAASAAPPHPRLVRIAVASPAAAEEVLRAGLDLIRFEADGHALLFEWPGDSLALARLGAPVEVVDADPTASAIARGKAALATRPSTPPALVRSATRADGLTRLEPLPAFSQGSWLGYWSVDEIKSELDSLVADDPRGLVADKLDTLGYSYQGRPIWGLRIGRAVTGPDPRPVVFMNALTHAREPIGMQALLYFVQRLLSDYGVDPFATYLLDERVLYIAPLVNPDGYAYNGVGGMWRKNLDGTGVDINRNYGFRWGYDNTGSSGSPTSEVYRGPAPFSEPETRAQRDAVVLLRPATGLSLHTAADDFLHAWGYTNDLPVDADAFHEWDDLATRWNRYASGETNRTLYPTNGDFDDWTYGDTAAKPRAFTWTPELGTSSDGFWPEETRIVPISEECRAMCATVMALAGPYVQLVDHLLPPGTLAAGGQARFALRVRNHGLAATGPGLVAGLVSLDPSVVVLSGPVHYPALGPRTTAEPLDGERFWLACIDTLTPGRCVRLRCDFSTPDGLYSRDTLDVLVGSPTVAFAEDGTVGLPAWSSIAGDSTVSAGSDAHPDAFVRLGAEGALVMRGALDLSRGVHAWLTMDAAWSPRPTSFTSYLPGDFATYAEASLDGVTWVPLAGPQTVRPSGATILTGPALIGDQFGWGRVWFDLSPLTGPTASRVRFRLRLANRGTEVGVFEFDSLRVLLFDPALQPPPVAVDAGAAPARLALAPPRPNPARARVWFDLALPGSGPVSLEVFDLQGRRVATLESGVLAAGPHAVAWDGLDAGGRALRQGVYLVRLRDATAQVVRRVALVR